MKRKVRIASSDTVLASHKSYSLSATCYSLSLTQSCYSTNFRTGTYSLKITSPCLFSTLQLRQSLNSHLTSSCLAYNWWIGESKEKRSCKTYCIAATTTIKAPYFQSLRSPIPKIRLKFRANNRSQDWISVSILCRRFLVCRVGTLSMTSIVPMAAQ